MIVYRQLTIPISKAVREGRRRDKDTWKYTLNNEPDLFAGRGFTSHSLSRKERIGKYLPYFNLYNMNGRLYDPVVGRFLSPDNYVQMPDFTQNFNRYSYALNNPLKYVDPSGEFFWIIPHIGWSKEGGFSFGISFVFGLPGMLSFQVGGGISNTGGYAFAGASAMFNTAYASYSSSGLSVGYTAGTSMFSGLPISTNFLTVGASYNITHNSWSGNVSAWNVSQNGWDFNPSVSAMIYPEHTTNFVRRGKFVSNDKMLKEFGDDYAGALKYFGFKGTFSDKYENDGWFTPKTGINYSKGAFSSYDNLFATYLKEFYEERAYLRGKRVIPDNPTGVDDLDRWPEEYAGHKYVYRNQGLCRHSKPPQLKLIRQIEMQLNKINGYEPGFYNFTPFQVKWWHKIFTIRRLY